MFPGSGALARKRNRPLGLYKKRKVFGFLNEALSLSILRSFLFAGERQRSQTKVKHAELESAAFGVIALTDPGSDLGSIRMAAVVWPSPQTGAVPCNQS